MGRTTTAYKNSKVNSNVISLSDKKAKDLIEQNIKTEQDLDIDKIIEKSTFKPEDMKNKTPTERLNLMLDVLSGLVPIAEGMYRSKPYPNYAYSLTNLINQYQGIEDQLNSIIDWEKLSDEVVGILRPIIEKLILNFGKNLRAELVDLSKKVGNSKEVKKTFNKIYRDLGKELTGGLIVLEEDVRDHLLKN